jgi:hypothetical protein
MTDCWSCKRTGLAGCAFPRFGLMAFWPGGHLAGGKNEAGISIVRTRVANRPSVVPGMFDCRRPLANVNQMSTPVAGGGPEIPIEQGVGLKVSVTPSPTLCTKPVSTSLWPFSDSPAKGGPIKCCLSLDLRRRPPDKDPSVKSVPFAEHWDRACHRRVLCRPLTSRERPVNLTFTALSAGYDF